MVESNQKMPSTPTLRSIDFYFLRAGIQQVSAEGDIITGVWESPIPDDVRRDIEGHLPLTWPPRLPGPGATVEEFVNTRRDIQAVARFTKRYGPLEEDPRDGAKFRFPVASWFEWQTRLQSEWRFIASGRWRDLGAIVHHRQPYPRDTWWFDVVEGRLLYRARLRDFLEFDLWSLRPLERDPRRTAHRSGNKGRRNHRHDGPHGEHARGNFQRSRTRAF